MGTCECFRLGGEGRAKLLAEGLVVMLSGSWEAKGEDCTSNLGKVADPLGVWMVWRRRLVLSVAGGESNPVR